jgi:hypothetical protein
MTAQSEQAWRLLEKAPLHDLTTRDSGIEVGGGPVLHALDQSGSRHLLVPLGDEAPGLEDKASKGVTVTTRHLLADADGAGQRFIDVKCEQRSLKDLFSTVCDEMLSRLELSGEAPGLAVNVVLDRWRELLGPSGSRLLSEQAIKGLLAELHLLEEIARRSPHDALLLWTGVDMSRHDFTGEALSVEVKASTASDVIRVHINGLRQLAPPAEGGTLYLLVERFERVPVGGDSLSDALHRLVETGIDELAILQAVGKVGIVPTDLDAYRAVRLARVERRLYLVDHQFPRLVPDMLHAMPAADRISGVEYWLDLGAQPPVPLSQDDLDALPERLVGTSEGSR